MSQCISVLFSFLFEGNSHSSTSFCLWIFLLFFYPLSSPSAFTFVCLGRLSSQLDNEECSVTLTSISPCMTFWLAHITFDLLFDSLINYPVLWFMSKCYVKIIDNRWSSKILLWYIFFSCLTWWAVLSLELSGTKCVWQKHGIFMHLDTVLEFRRLRYIWGGNMAVLAGCSCQNVHWVETESRINWHFRHFSHRSRLEKIAQIMEGAFFKLSCISNSYVYFNASLVTSDWLSWPHPAVAPTVSQ